MRSKAAKVALCGVVSALSVVLMLMTGIVPIATIALPALAGCLTIAIVAETNVRYGFAVYCVVSVLAILLTPDREAILFYILFFGYYPTLYGLLMRIKRKPLRVLAKFGVFNLAMALETAMAVWVLQIPLSEMEVFGNGPSGFGGDAECGVRAVRLLDERTDRPVHSQTAPACTEIYKIKQPMAAVFRVPWAVRFVQLILR